MSFAKEVKKELTLIDKEECCLKAEFDAYLRFNTNYIKNNNDLRLEFQTMNPSIARRFFVIAKKLYDVEISMDHEKLISLNKKTVYKIIISSKVEEIIKNHTEDLYENNCCNISFIRGSFLSIGSINNPVNNYHMEFTLNKKEDAIFLQKILLKYNITTKIAKRRNHLIVYLKEVEIISDFLKLIGAIESMHLLEDIRIRKDYNVSINRVINCQIANEMKSLDASNKQRKIIKSLEKKIGIQKIPEKLKQVMELRKKYPDYSIQALSDKSFEMGLNLTKSCINHRLRKIKEMLEK